MQFSSLLKLRSELSLYASNSNIGEDINLNSIEISPNNNKKKQKNINSPNNKSLSIVNNFNLPKISKNFHLNKNLINNLNKIEIGNRRKIQNSFSSLSEINRNNLSFSLNSNQNNIRKKIKIFPNNNNHTNNNSSRKILKPLRSIKPLDLDYSYSYNNFLNNSSSLANNSLTNINSLLESSINNNKNNVNINNTSIINNNNNQDIIRNLISIDKFNNIKSETMEKYKFEKVSKHSVKEEVNLDGNLFGNQSSVEHTKTSDQIKKLYDCGIKVNVEDKNFCNPGESKDVIDTNKFIYDNLKGSLFDIQKIVYDKTINDIEKYNTFKKQMKNIRISTLIPKTSAEKMMMANAKLTGTEKGVLEENSNANINGNEEIQNGEKKEGEIKELIDGEIKNSEEGKKNGKVDGEEEGEEGSGDNMELENAEEENKNQELLQEKGEVVEDDYMEKKKEKEKLKQNKNKKITEKEEKEKEKEKDNKNKNRNVLKIENEFYAEYKYSTKIFPEGREQFSLKYNLVDCVMFGGLVTNKNNNYVWKLDPCRKYFNLILIFFLFIS